MFILKIIGISILTFLAVVIMLVIIAFAYVSYTVIQDENYEMEDKSYGNNKEDKKGNNEKEIQKQQDNVIHLEKRKAQ